MHPPSDSFRHSGGFILRAALLLGLLVIGIVWLVRAYVLPPAAFPQEATIMVEQGDDLGTVAYKLEQAHIVRSADALKLMVLALGDAGKISIGSYFFSAPITSIEVALKITGNAFGVLQNKVTIPEGYTNQDIARRMAERFPDFDTARFLAIAAGRQGYLFPDTYSFNPTVSPEEVLNTLERTFTARTAPLESEFAASARSRKDIVIMASILEKEAGSAEELPVIAGILWKRIDRGIALQVDAPLAVLLGKTSAELTLRDLANQSPYNTYVHRGLPPGPIGNPGLAAIEAALRPVDSPYLYYLHDTAGGIHYASTFEEHKQNKARYLD